MATRAKARSWGICKDSLQTLCPFSPTNTTAWSDQVFQFEGGKTRSPACVFLSTRNKQCVGLGILSQPVAAACCHSEHSWRTLCRAQPSPLPCAAGLRTGRHGDRKQSTEASLEPQNIAAPGITPIYHLPSACLSPCPGLPFFSLTSHNNLGNRHYYYH